MKLTYEIIKKFYKKYGYRFYTQAYDLNICFFRNPEKINNNVFNDIGAVCYIDELGTRRLFAFKCTVDPGRTALINPKNPKGTAIIVPGQYPSLWRVGLHRGYPALVQINCISVYRDKNKDGKADLRGIKDFGLFGINLHRARTDRVVKNVDNFSEGCVVIPDSREMDRVIDLVDIQNKYGLGDKVSGTFFDEPVVFDPDVEFV